MRSIEPGIRDSGAQLRTEVWSFGPSRNDSTLIFLILALPRARCGYSLVESAGPGYASAQSCTSGRHKHEQAEHIRPSGLHHNPAYSHVVVASGARTIYISGQVSTDDEGRVVGEGDLAAQTTQVMHNIGLALKAAGASYANIVKITTFVVGYKPELRPIIGKARSVFFEGMEPPASTLVGVTALAAPEWLIEIEAVAVVD